MELARDNREPVTWDRVRQILADAMARWEGREGRPALPGIHGFSWDTPDGLANELSMGRKFIESGVPAEETNLVIALRRGFGSIPRMPMNGPFVREEEIQQIVDWIESGMPG